MDMILLFNRLNKKEGDLLRPPATRPDSFWIKPHQQQALSYDFLKECLTTQEAMEARAAKVLDKGEYTMARYRLLPDGFAGAIHFSSPSSKRAAP